MSGTFQQELTINLFSTRVGVEASIPFIMGIHFDALHCSQCSRVVSCVHSWIFSVTCIAHVTSPPTALSSEPRSKGNVTRTGCPLPFTSEYPLHCFHSYLFLYETCWLLYIINRMHSLINMLFYNSQAQGQNIHVKGFYGFL